MLVVVIELLMTINPENKKPDDLYTKILANSITSLSCGVTADEVGSLLAERASHENTQTLRIDCDKR